MKRIHLVHTGGTLGMAPVSGRLLPGPFLDSLLEDVPELRRVAEVDVEILMNLDSTDMVPADWDRIGSHLAARMGDYDGFVVIHGTDTMAHTAAALSYSLGNLAKPVVLTGSQRPLKAIPTDGRTNLVYAVDLASRDVPEVCVFFGRQLLRGNRARKVSSERYDAFESPNYPPLGRVGLEVDLHPALVRRPTGPFAHVPGFVPAVAWVACFPGAPADAIDRAVDAGARVVVVGAFGTGNVPGGERGWPTAIRRASARGAVVLLLTQCPHGTVRPRLYEGGRAALDAGAVPGHDLTVEAALVKAMFLLGRGLGPEALGAALERDLAGEITPGGAVGR
jgi:L-asparaginase